MFSTADEAKKICKKNCTQNRNLNVIFIWNLNVIFFYNLNAILLCHLNAIEAIRSQLKYLSEYDCKFLCKFGFTLSMPLSLNFKFH